MRQLRLFGEFTSSFLDRLLAERKEGKETGYHWNGVKW